MTRTTGLAAVGVSPQDVPQQKSVTELAIVVDYVEKPTTLERATARADAIVRARVVGSQFRNLREPGAPVPDVNTAYTLKVIEVLKQNPQLPIPTEVLRPGLPDNAVHHNRVLENGSQSPTRGGEGILPTAPAARFGALKGKKRATERELKSRSRRNRQKHVDI